MVLVGDCFEICADDGASGASVHNDKIAAITHSNTAVTAVGDTGVDLKITHGCGPKQECAGCQINEISAVELLQ
jgi:hypothetical protein